MEYMDVFVIKGIEVCQKSWKLVQAF